MEKEGIVLQVADLAFANTHAAGTASGEYRAQEKGPGWVDISAHLTRPDGAHVHDYLPITLNAQARRSVHDAVLAGSASDARLKLKGDLQQFPFVGDRGGTFQIEAKVTEAVLDYAPGWPRIEHIRGDLRFHGNRMDVASEESETLSVNIGKVSVAIPDLAHARLLIQGESFDQT